MKLTTDESIKMKMKQNKIQWSKIKQNKKVENEN